ncbi:MAG: threonine/serine exporter family protein [Pirellula sp.]|nr:threonine/serine exporter family protein [Pirellula sp.]
MIRSPLASNFPFSTTSTASELDQLKYDFLIRTGELLHKYGTPSHRLERVMTKIARTLGVESVFLYTPTALVAAFGEGREEKTFMRRVDSGSVDAEKLIQFDEILERLEAGEIDIASASEAMELAAAAKPLYSTLATALVCGIGCACVAVFFRGGWEEILTAGLIGLSIAGIDIAQSKLGWEAGLVFPVSGFFAGIVSLGISRFIHPIDDRLVTLASLIVLLPGFSLTMALTELAVGHLSAGVARLAGATVTLVTLFLGVAISWRIAGEWRIETPLVEPVDQWVHCFRVRLSLWPVVFAISLSGYFTATWFGAKYGVEVGSFLGALVVGSGSNLFARLRDRPALVPLAPGMILLVPGSLGYRSLSALLNRQTVEGIEFAFGMIVVAISLVGGLLASSALVPPKRIL